MSSDRLTEQTPRSFATTSAKRVIGIMIVFATVGFVMLVVALISLTVTRVSTGADPSTALKEVLQIPDGLEERVTWQPDPMLDRAVEPVTRELIESTWVSAWAQLGIAQRSGDPDGLQTWFIGDLHDLTATLVSGTPDATTEQIDHTLSVSFYSVDGSVMTVDAVSRMDRSIAGWPEVQTTEHFEVVLLLSDGNWRIKGLTRTSVEPR